jgi:hypothetical protein
MRHIVWFLPFVTRGLALCAVLAGLCAGLLWAFAASFVCVDACPTRDFYFSYLGPSTVRTMTPCIVLEVFAVAAFVAYSLATRQVRRAVFVALVLVVGGLVGVAALDALLQHAQVTLPSEGHLLVDILQEGPVEAWAHLWGLALTLVAGAWSGVLALLLWRR